jgi:hypothetical protein
MINFDGDCSASEIEISLHCTDLNERINNVLDYCEPHLDQMWAAYIVGLLLKCDFRNAKEELEKYNKKGLVK